MDSNIKCYEVVAAVVVHNGEVLCMQKGQTPFPYTTYKWEFPGGKIELNETPEQALQRELMEEMNYPIIVHEKLCEVEYTYPDFGVHIQFFLCAPDNNQDAQIARTFTRREHNDHQWLAPSNLCTLDWCAADLPAAQLIVNSLMLYPAQAVANS